MAVADRILAVGLSHHSAPVEVREKFALAPDAVKMHLDRLRADGLVEEAMIVSTCNRVELYAIPTETPEKLVRAWLDRSHGDVESFLRRHAGRDAVLHLFRVASSLDSLVMGEPQILGQVKDAVRLAEEAHALGRVLGPLARKALTVAKRVRTETDIGRFRVGVGNAGVDLATQVFGELTGKEVLLLGTGEMGRQVAKALVAEGARLRVSSRTLDNARALATEHGGTAIPWDRFAGALATVDIVITAVGVADPVVTPAMVREVVRARRFAPLFIVDLAVPRNVDPAVAQFGDVYLFNVDDLERVLEDGLNKRSAAGAQAQRLVEAEADAFVSGLGQIEAGPLLGQVAKHAEQMRLAELARSTKLTDTLDEAQKAQLDVMSKALVKRLLDGTMRRLREKAAAGDEEAVRLVLSLWGE